MRKILVAALFVASVPTLFAAAPAAPETGCARFKLNGYALGMSPADAAAVRPLKGTMPDEGMVSVEVDNGVSGTLTFVGGRVAEYRARFDGAATSVSELRKQLVTKFGKPAREVESGTTVRLLWSDPGCDRSVMAEWDQPAAETTKEGKTIVPHPSAFTVALGVQKMVVPYLDLPAATRKLLE